MPRLMVTQGEIGVMHPGNRATVTELGTFGASPCIILGIQKGSTALMAHIHRANKISKVMKQIDKILADAVPATDTPRAFIATETYSGTRQGEAATQTTMIMLIEAALRARGIVLIHKDLTKSAAIIRYDGYSLYVDNDNPAGFTMQEVMGAVNWALAYDTLFGNQTGELKMAIRVGTNAEQPAQALSRMYG